jgi:hypothetical protein
LYNIISTPDYGAFKVTISVEKGIKIYTFTFG